MKARGWGVGVLIIELKSKCLSSGRNWSGPEGAIRACLSLLALLLVQRVT